MEVCADERWLSLVIVRIVEDSQKAELELIEIKRFVGHDGTVRDDGSPDGKHDIDAGSLE